MSDAGDPCSPSRSPTLRLSGNGGYLLGLLPFVHIILVIILVILILLVIGAAFS